MGLRVRETVGTASAESRVGSWFVEAAPVGRLLGGCRGRGRGLGGRSRDAGLGRLPDHDDVDDVRGNLAADDAVDRVGLHRVLVEDGVDLGGRIRPTVAHHALGLHDPFVSAERVQSPSPCPPSESKFHDLIWPLWGSQPMNMVPEVGFSPWMWAV